MTGTVCMSWDMHERKLHAVLGAERQTDISVILPSWAENVQVKKAEGGPAGRSLSADGRTVRLELKAGETAEIECGAELE